MKGVPKWRTFHRHSYPVIIVATGTQRQFREMRNVVNFDAQSPVERDSMACTYVIRSAEVMPVIVVALRPDNGEFALATLAHEATHVVQYVEETIGIRLDDESEAYMVGALTDWLAGVFLRSGGEIHLPGGEDRDDE